MLRLRSVLMLEKYEGKSNSRLFCTLSDISSE